ncbi:hypothetical protein BJV78DRAFT_1247537 [Lactifluus subvellereus]|nr:hypothetical protein BJV78DRAFT_1247537 [Lactifluus subvellereus]
MIGDFDDSANALWTLYGKEAKSHDEARIQTLKEDMDGTSQQISSIAPQVATPATPPPPFPTFKPSASDIHVNVFWFMALVFSLSAALFATLVQQWVRDYMHVFQRHDGLLKSARLRQYLYDG